jgi:hypothetical protein
MLSCDLARMLGLTVLGLLVLLGWATWPAVLAIAMFEAAASVPFFPAEQAALPVVVPSEQLEQALAVNEARHFGGSIAGPPLGGALYALTPAAPFLADGISYALSFVMIRGVRGRFEPSPEEAIERKPLIKEIVDGVAYVWRTPFLRAVAVQIPLINLAFTGANFTIILSLRENGVSAPVIGIVGAAVAVGGVVGAFVAPRLKGRMRVSTTVTVLCVAVAVLGAVGGVILPSPLVAVPIAFMVLLTPTVNAVLIAGMIRRTPAYLRGRVNTTIVLAALSLGVFAPLISGLLVSEMSGSVAMISFGAIAAVAAVVAAASPGLRRNGDELLSVDVGG